MKRSFLILALLLWTTVALAITVIPGFQAGEAGLQITWVPNESSNPVPVSLTGLTVNMIYGLSGNNVNTVKSCTVAADGLSASYTTSASDFATAGTYNVQFTAAGGGGAIFRKSPVQTLVVRPNLATPTPTPAP